MDALINQRCSQYLMSAINKMAIFWIPRHTEVTTAYPKVFSRLVLNLANAASVTLTIRG